MKKALLITGILGILLGGLIIGLGLVKAIDGIHSGGNGLIIARVIGGLIIIPSVIAAIVGVFLTLKDAKPAAKAKNRISVEWYIIIYVGTFLLAIASLSVQFITSYFLSPLTASIGGRDYAHFVPGVLLILLFVFIVMGIVLHFHTLIKLWSAINDGEASTTPGKAIGFLFVPIINIIWIGLVWINFPDAYDKFVKRHGLDLPVFRSSAFNLYGILLIMPGFSLFFIFMLPFIMRTGFEAINDLNSAMEDAEISLEDFSGQANTRVKNAKLGVEAVR